MILFEELKLSQFNWEQCLRYRYNCYCMYRDIFFYISIFDENKWWVEIAIPNLPNFGTTIEFKEGINAADDWFCENLGFNNEYTREL